MKKSIFIVAVICFLLAGMASATVFQKVDLTGASDVLNDGTLEYAYNIADTTDAVINGLTFVANDGSGVTGGPGAVAFYDDGNPGGYIYNTAGGGLADFLQVMNSEAYLSQAVNIVGSLSFDLSGLTIGEDYRLQFLMGDTRTDASSAIFNHLMDVTVQGVTLSGVSNDTTEGYNLMIGFTATDTTESVLLEQLGDGNAAVIVAGYALHSGVTVVPEPATLALLSLGGLVLRRRRSKQ